MRGIRFRKRFGIPDGETVFLFVGSGFARKGVGTIARAARLLAERGCEAFRVVLVGKGDPSTYVRSAGPASGRLLFTGPVAGADDLFLGADAFLFPTVYEPFSNACLEAMAAGLPVVTTAVNGASEVLREGESGFLLEDPFDAAALADRMEKLLSSDLRRRMGEQARRVAEAYPVERNTRETLEVLDRVLEDEGRLLSYPGCGFSASKAKKKTSRRLVRSSTVAITYRSALTGTTSGNAANDRIRRGRKKKSFIARLAHFSARRAAR